MSASESVTDKSIESSNIQVIGNPEILQPTRDESGRFLPGFTGNPAGRTPTVALTEYLRHKVEELGYAPKIGDQLVEAAAGERQLKPGQLDAANTLMDRVYGKAVQNTNVRGLIVMMPSDQVLAEAFGGDEPE